MKSVTLMIGVSTLLLNAAVPPTTALASDSHPYSPHLQAGSSTEVNDKQNEALKIAALEGLMSAPYQRSLPIIQKVLDGNSSVNVKRKALFVLGQHEQSQAQTLLLEYAQRPGALQVEAIRMIGVGGQRDTLSQLQPMFSTSTQTIKEAILQAYLIADDTSSVLEIAKNAATDETFDAAVRTLGAMDARDELRTLFDRGRNRESLTRAYAIAGDLDSLTRMARGAQTEDQRIAAIRSIGIVGTDEAKRSLVALYRSANNSEIRDAALQGMIISGHDQGVLTLFRESQDLEHKQALMRSLVIMDSDLVIDVIDSTLSGRE